MRNKILIFIIICAVLGAMAIVVLGNLRSPDMTRGSVTAAPKQKKVVIFDPRDYNHKPFPFIEDIDIDVDLIHGRWIVVLYSYGCMSCMRELPRYFDLAKSLQSTKSDTHIALIEVPPYAPVSRHLVSPDSGCASGKLSNGKTWFISTPVALILDDGIVVHYAEGSST